MKDLHAIKVLDPALTRNPQLVTRFVNEARAAAALRHPNLVRVHNIECVPDGPWFMVLDYLDGQSLAHFLATRHGPLASSLILHILAQVASCIQRVHDHHIVHRDLKPDNIFLIQHGADRHFPVVLDLGVAQLSEELSAGPLTRTGTVIGTPIYMAPEQLRGERVSAAADIFALGVIAYELSTGGYFPYQVTESREAYIELSVTELYHRQCSASPVEPRRRCPGLGEAWAGAVCGALAPDPCQRPPSAAAFALRLAEAAAAGPDPVDGPGILRAVAPDLLAGTRPGDHGSERSMPWLRGAQRAPRVDRDRWAEPVTTLAGAASQSLHLPPPPPRRWPRIAAGGLAALVAGAGGVLGLTRLVDAPPTRSGAVPAEPAAATPARSASAASAPLVADATAEPPHHEQAGVAAGSPALPAAAESSITGVRAAIASPTPVTHHVPPAPAVARSPTAARFGALAIVVRPWAKAWLNDQYLGVTPCSARLAAGTYTLRLGNDAFGRVETQRITIMADQTTRIDLRWTDNQPDPQR